jgi:hypothetical protein
MGKCQADSETGQEQHGWESVKQIVKLVKSSRDGKVPRRIKLKGSATARMHWKVPSRIVKLFKRSKDRKVPSRIVKLFNNSRDGKVPSRIK